MRKSPMTPDAPHPPRHARRGSVYLFVLSVAVLVAGLGLLGLASLRVERRSVDLDDSVLRARWAASSLQQVIAQRLCADPAWRQTYTHDVWEPNESIDGLTFRFKLVDEQDGDLANDATQPVRLYSQVAGDQAVLRTYSVELQPPTLVNLLANPGFESGTAKWQGWNCDLRYEPTLAHQGNACAYLEDRESPDATAWQDITAVVQKDTPYYVEAWVETLAFTEAITLSLKATADLSGTAIWVTPAVTTGTTWSRVFGWLTPTWSGTLTEARWRAFSYPGGGMRDFYLDDTVLVEASALVSRPVPGTFRREVLP